MGIYKQVLGLVAQTAAGALLFAVLTMTGWLIYCEAKDAIEERRRNRMKNCANCGNQRSIHCADCKTGNPPTMWCPEQKEDADHDERR